MSVSSAVGAAPLWEQRLEGTLGHWVQGLSAISRATGCAELGMYEGQPMAVPATGGGGGGHEQPHMLQIGKAEV